MGNINSNVNKMGLAALTMVTASNMMGSGVFMLPANLGKIGAISTYGWIFTIIGVIALALVFAKTSLLTPRTGGIVSYASEAFGPFVGFQSTLCYWISAWVGNVALLVAGVGYLSYFFPALKNPAYSSICCIVILWAFVLLSSFGAKVAGRSQSFTGTCMLIVVLGIGAIGWFWFKTSTFTEVYNGALNANGSSASNSSAIISAASLTLWGFLGVESAVVSTGQVVNPERNVPRATVYGLLIAAVCYVASCTVIMGIIPHNELMNSAAPFADAARIMFNSNLAGDIVSALSIIACFGSISGWIILQSEAPRAAAQQNLFPKFFADLNNNGVPIKSIAFTGVLMSIVLLMTASPNLSEQFQIVILLSVFASLLPYMYAIIALPIIRLAKKYKNRKAALFYLILVLIAFCYCIFALIGSGSKSILYGVILMVITIPLYSYVSINRAQHDKAVLFVEESNILNSDVK